MHVSVLNFVDFVGVPVVGEAAEATAVQVHSQWLVVSDQDVDPHVKLLAPDKQRVHDIPLHNIRLGLWAVRLPPEIVLPLRNLRQFV